MCLHRRRIHRAGIRLLHICRRCGLLRIGCLRIRLLYIGCLRIWLLCHRLPLHHRSLPGGTLHRCHVHGAGIRLCLHRRRIHRAGIRLLHICRRCGLLCIGCLRIWLLCHRLCLHRRRIHRAGIRLLHICRRCGLLCIGCLRIGLCLCHRRCRLLCHGCLCHRRLCCLRLSLRHGCLHICLLRIRLHLHRRLILCLNLPGRALHRRLLHCRLRPDRLHFFYDILIYIPAALANAVPRQRPALRAKIKSAAVCHLLPLIPSPSALTVHPSTAPVPLM